MKRSIFVTLLVATFVLASFLGSAMATSGEVLILHFDEGSGTIAKDASGHGNDGTIYGAIWIDGKYGKALSFDGVDDYVELPNINLDNSDLTIEAWAYVNSMGSDRGIICRWGKGSPDRPDPQFVLYADESTTDCWRTGITGSDNQHKLTKESANCNPGGVIQTKTWTHVAMTYKNNDKLRLYVNGLEVDNVRSNAVGLNPTNYLPRIGNDVNGNRPFDGIIDEVRIYNRALTADEIKTHYEGKKPALTLAKSASPSIIQEGETTTISIRIENTGTVDAKAIEVTDTIPTGFKILSGLKFASFDKIKPGDYRTCEYTLKATGSGKFMCEPATATYKDADGNSYSAASNSVSIQVGGEVPVGADSDGDGWSDEKEREMGTNPYSVDSDGDGLKDPEDPNPTVPEEKKTPGFEVTFAIAGLLAVGYLLRGRK